MARAVAFLFVILTGLVAGMFAPADAAAPDLNYDSASTDYDAAQELLVIDPLGLSFAQPSGDSPSTSELGFAGTIGGKNRPALGPAVDFVAPTSALDDVVRLACSFSGETEVLMADGTTRPISEIEIGDWVLAEDPKTEQRGVRRVEHVFVHGDTIVDLGIGGHDVATTADHPFWNHSDREWQRADGLDVGDLVLSASGELLLVDGLDWGSARTTTAYNLNVDGIHTYFVAVGDAEVLVHNQCGEMLSRPSQIADRFGVSTREVNDAIHALKTNIPGGAPVRNPDVVVDAVTGEVFPQIPGGGLGDSIGNIFDVLPGAG